ncbi:MAG: TlpA disulfide reductase family protein, partial [Draconibacterium sp.]|nr:TlpA disulfide reductase family protein [Draconibacterium sp.]
LFASFVFCSLTNLVAQPYTLQLQVSGQPEIPVILGRIKGDKFIPVDSVKVQPVTFSSPAESGTQNIHPLTPGHRMNISKLTFHLPENSTPGVYRLIFGKTRVAEIMNEPPQQLDFIFNHENLVFETDFKAPDDSLKINQSVENLVWFAFKKQEKEYKAQIKELEMEVNYFQASAKPPEAAKRIEEYNRLQKKRDELITKIVTQYPNLFATKLIKMHREPFLDGNLSEQQRKEIFKAEFFNTIDFEDETLINTSVYTTKVFQYLMLYAQKGLKPEQQEQEFMKAVEIILEAIHTMTQSHSMNNSKVYEFILDYLVRGFEQMNLNNVLKSIAGKYEGTTCQTDEKTTLERRLAFLKYMTVGATVFDFTLNDINGDPVTLSQIKKGKTLLVFWASWCPHCTEMLPQIKNRQKQQNQQELEIVAISLDSSETEWKNKVNELGIESWYNLSGLKEWDGEVAVKYNIYATPTLIVIGKDRGIISLPVNLDEFKSTF